MIRDVFMEENFCRHRYHDHHQKHWHFPRHHHDYYDDVPPHLEHEPEIDHELRGAEVEMGTESVAQEVVNRLKGPSPAI